MENYTEKVKEIIKGIDQEIEQFEKALSDADEHAQFISGHVAGLKRAKTTIEIFFHKELNGETKDVQRNE